MLLTSLMVTPTSPTIFASSAALPLLVSSALGSSVIVEQATLLYLHAPSSTPLAFDFTHHVFGTYTTAPSLTHVLLPLSSLNSHVLGSLLLVTLDSCEVPVWWGGGGSGFRLGLPGAVVKWPEQGRSIVLGSCFSSRTALMKSCCLLI